MGCEKVTDRIGLAGCREPRLFPGCVAVSDSIEIQDALILPALCYVYVSLALSAARGRVALRRRAARPETRIRGLLECPMVGIPEPGRLASMSAARKWPRDLSVPRARSHG